jgi:hypothetical protein
MALVVLNGPIIQAGNALSDGLDCSSGRLVRITMPATWTPANLSFAISSDGVFYNDLFHVDGTEVSIPVVPGSAVIVAHLGSILDAIMFLKVRSGTRLFPIVQPTQRAFAVALDRNPSETTEVR